jgi:hypothetical protein
MLRRAGCTVHPAWSAPCEPRRTQTLISRKGWSLKKLKHEAELFKAALAAGIRYAEGRKAVEFEATDSASDKALYVYFQLPTTF